MTLVHQSDSLSVTYTQSHGGTSTWNAAGDQRDLAKWLRELADDIANDVPDEQDPRSWAAMFRWGRSK